MQNLNEIPITSLNGVGPGTQKLLSHLNIYNLQDLLFHLPLRYQDRTTLMPIRALRPGIKAMVEGKIISVEIVGKRKPHLVCRLNDGTGTITLRFFHYNKYQKERLNAAGANFKCFGEIRPSYQGGYEIFHPEILQANKNIKEEVLHLTPIYSTTQGLSQLTLRKLISQALEVAKRIPEKIELLPNDFKAQFGLMHLGDALIYVHNPPADAPIALLEGGGHPCQKRLSFEELITHQLTLQQLRHNQKNFQAPIFHGKGELAAQIQLSLPFKLTSAQQRVIQEILEDLKKAKPMLRLVQGDVGSGKTIVCAVAALQAIESGFQAAIMAPTELLAEQHYQNFKHWLTPLGITVGMLTGSQTVSLRKENFARILTGEYQVVVGTHALFQEKLEFRNLALLIIDEQHRFGVHQRLALQEKGQRFPLTSSDEKVFPHQLIMTATPIPRTLAMAAYADLDFSVIDEMPPGRVPITTVLIPNSRRWEVLQHVRDNCKKSQRQAYWVCTLIEDSEVIQCQAAEATAKDLANALPELKIGLIHGRLKSEEKEKIMNSFKAGMIDLLVSTTVIEVGVDVPNASLMIIENPERLGLAQLHQLRGRIGRGSLKSHCVLLYQAPLSHNARERLMIIRSTQDGFEIAQKDLAMRGPGEVLGTRQTGLAQMRIADLIRDKELLPQAQLAGKIIVEKYPDLIPQLMGRWISGKEQYARV